MQIVKTLSEQISKFAQVTLDSLAYSGTGNVLKVQELLAMCGEHIETEDSTAWKVGPAPLVLCGLVVVYARVHVRVVQLTALMPARRCGMTSISTA